MATRLGQMIGASSWDRVSLGAKGILGEIVAWGKGAFGRESRLGKREIGASSWVRVSPGTKGLLRETGEYCLAPGAKGLLGESLAQGKRYGVSSGPRNQKCL